jgi:hypothetical protein
MDTNRIDASIPSPFNFRAILLSIIEDGYLTDTNTHRARMALNVSDTELANARAEAGKDRQTGEVLSKEHIFALAALHDVESREIPGEHMISFVRAIERAVLEKATDPAGLVRNHALEDAAKVADGFYDHIRQYTTDVPDIGGHIRDLKTDRPA